MFKILVDLCGHLQRHIVLPCQIHRLVSMQMGFVLPMSFSKQMNFLSTDSTLIRSKGHKGSTLGCSKHIQLKSQHVLVLITVNVRTNFLFISSLPLLLLIFPAQSFCTLLTDAKAFWHICDNVLENAGWVPPLALFAEHRVVIWWLWVLLEFLRVSESGIEDTDSSS